MAIIPCRECGKEVSASAAKCPHCGVATPNQARRTQNQTASIWGCGCMTMLALGMFAMCVAGNSSTSEDTRSRVAATEVRDARIQAVKETLEQQPGVRVEVVSGSLFKVHIDRLDMTDLQARQMAKATWDRIGGDAAVVIYDRSGLERARASTFGVR